MAAEKKINGAGKQLMFLESVKIGRVRIAGYLGHTLYHLVEARRAIGIGVLAISLMSLFSVGAARGVRTFLNWEAQSPIAKDAWVVENTHAEARDLVVRRGTTHLRLHCTGDIEWSDYWKHLDHGYGCLPVKEGQEILLEHWDNDYVLKLDKGQENTYHEGSW